MVINETVIACRRDRIYPVWRFIAAAYGNDDRGPAFTPDRAMNRWTP